MSIATFHRAQTFNPNLKEIYQGLEWMKNNAIELDLDYNAYHGKAETVSDYLVFNNSLVCEKEKSICIENSCMPYQFFNVTKRNREIKKRNCSLFSAYPLYKYYDYPNSSYSIMNIFPYGHLVTYIAQRIPITNGFLHILSLNPSEQFFLAQEEKTANEIINNFNVKYVIIDDYSINAVKYMAKRWKTENQYFREVKIQKQKQIIYLPKYFNLIPIRLYLYNGNEYYPKQSYVFTNNEVRAFKSYNSALEYVEGNNNSMIVGIDPYESPVPLKEMHNYQLIYESDTAIAKNSKGEIKKVKIFELIK